MGHWARSDVGAAALAACVTGTATLPQYAGVLKPMVDAVHIVCLRQMLATEARERAGLRSRRDNWVMLTLHRLAVYPPGYQLAADVTRTVEDAVDMALTAPPLGGLLPERARLRGDCALFLLLLGDETGQHLRRRVWSHKEDAWHFAEDLIQAAQQTGEPAVMADDFMGVSPGHFQERLDDSRITLSNQPHFRGGETSTKKVVTYFDMAKSVRPSDDVCDSQIWSHQVA